jgi:hypothetical protein
LALEFTIYRDNAPELARGTMNRELQHPGYQGGIWVSDYIE